MSKQWKPYVPVAVVFGVIALLVIGRIPHCHLALKSSAMILLEMASILPAVVILMGLMQVWAPAQHIQKYLGKEAGAKGMLLSALLGALPTGPMYVAFPIAGSLLRKGAGMANIVILLGAWGAIKIPQIAVEVAFLGLRFAIVRLLFTLLGLIVMGLILAKLIPAHKGIEKYG